MRTCRFSGNEVRSWNAASHPRGSSRFVVELGGEARLAAVSASELLEAAWVTEAEVQLFSKKGRGTIAIFCTYR